MPRPDPLGHLLSCNRRAAGRNTGTACRRPRPKSRRQRSDSTARAVLSQKSIRLAIPPIDPLAQAARGDLTAGAGGPSGPIETPCSTLARDAGLARHGRRHRPLAQPAAWGSGPPHPPPREGPWDPLHPRCLPSMGCLCRIHWTFVQSSLHWHGVLHSLSPACGEHATPLFPGGLASSPWNRLRSDRRP